MRTFGHVFRKGINAKSLKKPWVNMVKRLEGKAKVFKNVADSARLQEKAFDNEAQALISTKKFFLAMRD